jgi:hypothetical protein
MKTPTQKQKFHAGLISLFLAVFLTAGCGAWLMKPSSKTISQQPDPLTGWKFLFSQDREKLSKMIEDDYQSFIQQLPPEEKKYIGDINFYEDATGRHAVSIEVFSNKTSALWYYALIYDKNNTRIKVAKYGYSRYQS